MITREEIGKISARLYSDNFGPLMKISEIKKIPGMFARVECSGSEGFFVEIAKFDYVAKKTYRFAFWKCFDRDEATAIVDEINSPLESLIHNMPNYADARLIVAAPDLLAACEHALQYLTGDTCPQPEELEAWLRAAIAKANGEAAE